MTVNDLLSWLVDGEFDFGALTWPADVFGVAGALLRRSGAYVSLVHDWPPREFSDLSEWVARCEDEARAWRASINLAQPTPLERLPSKVAPAAIRRRLERVRDHGGSLLADVPANDELVSCLLQLLLVADTTFSGCFREGLLEDHLSREAGKLLAIRHRLNSSAIPASRLVVLPKYSTPPVGMFPRSLSSNLSFCDGAEAKVKFYTWHLPEYWPEPNAENERKEAIETARDDALQLLVVPFPYRVDDEQFSKIPPPRPRHLLPSHFDYFRFTPADLHGNWTDVDREEFAAWVADLVAVAERTVTVRGERRKVWGVVFPETAFGLLTADSVAGALTKGFLLAGVGAPGGAGEWDVNSAHVKKLGRFVPDFHQRKSHRWKLDCGQINRYGLTSRFYDSCRDTEFWEAIDVRGRELNFIDLAGKFTFSIAICEDLARQEPGGDFLRAVAPHLLIALLNDGPQLPLRWSARYALAYADDPGTAVLTLTSLGMSRKSGCKESEYCQIGLWRDGRSGDLPIRLESGAHAVALPIRVRDEKGHFRADGFPVTRRVLELEHVDAGPAGGVGLSIRSAKEPPSVVMSQLASPAGVQHDGAERLNEGGRS
jgi:hypothetical protein